MIKRNLGTKEPAIFRNDEIVKIKSRLAKFYKDPLEKRRQQKPPADLLSAGTLKKLYAYLNEQFNSKCVYCESRITKSYPAHFDHFRPRGSAIGLKKEFSLDHYWPLVFEWRNLYLSCQVCDKYKGNWFPVENSRAPVKMPIEEMWKTEKNLIIDPCHDDPGEHLGYELTGRMIYLTEKGRRTIEILNLNRTTLVAARKAVITPLKKVYDHLKYLHNTKGIINITLANKEFILLLEETKKAFLNIADSSETFFGIRRYFITNWTQDFPPLMEALNKYLKVVPALFPGFRTSSNMPNKKRLEKALASVKVKQAISRLTIESIEIKNFKSIENLHIQFPQSKDNRESWLMLLGENGVGKSSFLQAVSLALMGSAYLKKLGIQAKDIYRHKASGQGLVKINATGRDPIEMTFNNKSIKHNYVDPPVKLLAYGSTRLFATKLLKPESPTNGIKARNIFFPDSALFAEDWLVKLRAKDMSKFDYAIRALKDLLIKELDDPTAYFYEINKNIWLKYSDPKRHDALLCQMSDGYKSVIALACDMMQSLLQEESTMENAEGIVLIDEIGTHLHPRWKMRIVNSFRSAFPRMHFIVTTHDPLCLKGINAGEVVVFNKDDNDKIFALTDLPDPTALKAEQLLSSRFFGLLSTIDEDLDKEFNEYYSLLSKGDKLSAKDKKRRVKLKEILRNKNHLGDNLREELALTAADQVLSEKLNSNDSMESLQSQTVSLLKDLWKKPLSEQEKISSQ